MNNITLAPVQPDQPSHLMPVFGRQPISFVRGRGSYLYTEDGTEYFDALTGIAVCGLGHAHPVIAEAIADQAATLIHTSNLFEVPWQTAAAQKLAEVSGMEEIFFSNSGAESNEGAIKIARKFGSMQGIAHPKIIVANHSFHGRTMATLSATGNKKVQEGFGPLVEGFIRVPFGDIEAIQEAAINHPDIVAIFVEPIQGEGGVNLPKDNYLAQVKALCEKYNALLILDEIQTGVGRTGKMFAYEHYGMKPDIVTLAKGLGGGMPIGAFIASDKVAQVFVPGDHGSTFGGNPLACAAANAVLDVIEEEKLLKNVNNMEKYFFQELNKLKDKYPQLITEVRGKGLIIGMELTQMGRDIVNECMKYGAIINCTAGNVLRFVPPLNITKAHVDELISVLDKVLPKYA